MFTILSCAKMHFSLCSAVTDIRFCKCSDNIYENRTQPAEIRHPGSVQPSVSIHASGLLGTYRTLTKSNVLHQSQRLKWFYARWQATLRKVYPCFFCTHILLKQQKKMHLWKRPFRLSLFFLEGKTGKQSCCGHMCESFKQSPPLNCRNICGGRGHACISGGKAPLISHEVATIHEQVAKRIANVRFTTRTYKNPLFVRRVVGAAL